MDGPLSYSYLICCNKIHYCKWIRDVIVLLNFSCKATAWYWNSKQGLIYCVFYWRKVMYLLFYDFLIAMFGYTAIMFVWSVHLCLTVNMLWEVSLWCIYILFYLIQCPGTSKRTRHNLYILVFEDHPFFPYYLVCRWGYFLVKSVRLPYEATITSLISVIHVL